MADFLGGLIGAGASILGAEINASEQQKINQANISNQQAINAENWQHALYMDTHHIQDLAADARKAGINPLAALGVSTPSIPTSVGATAQASGAWGKGLSQAGQDIGEAFTRYMDDNSRKSVLQEELLKAQIARENADTAGVMLSNSRQARLAGPGARAAQGPKTLTEDYEFHGLPLKLFGGKASQAMMNAANWPMIVPAGAALAIDNMQTWAKGLGRWSGADRVPGAVSGWLRDRRGTSYKLPDPVDVVP